MNFEEFLTPEQLNDSEEVKAEAEETVEVDEVDDSSIDLDVQKAVVESLAAEKIEQEEHISSMRKTIVELRSKLAMCEVQLALKTEELTKVGDRLSMNSEGALSNKVTLLEREPELKERFEGEVRDQVIEALKEAREIAEKEGRNRKAQILESVLLANESSGELEKKRGELEKLFAVNHNVINGTVIAELKKIGLSHKNGEEYLLPKEIIKRNY